MAWVFEQLTGKFIDPEGGLQAKGYSGQPPHRNDPDSEHLHNQGPIPNGKWQAVELIPESDKHGTFVVRLEPYPETQTFGRAGFLMHGDSVQFPGYASEGCIILPRDIRELFWNSLDHDLQVVRGVV